MRLNGSARILIAFALLTGGCGQESKLADSEVGRFAAAKKWQVEVLAQQQQLAVPGTCNDLFAFILADKWHKATNAFAQLQIQGGRTSTPMAPGQLDEYLRKLHEFSQDLGLPAPKDSALVTAPWHAMADAYWTYVLSKNWRKPMLDTVLQEISKQLPPKCIFFGDSDLGRFGMSLFVEFHAQRSNIFVITQNQLIDPTYLDYINSRYGTRIFVPSARDYQDVYSEYLKGLHGSGQSAVKGMNAKLAKLLFNQNSNRPIYIESSWYLPGWANAYLVPRGPVFEIERHPSPTISEQVVQADRDYWAKICKSLIGDWLRPETTVKDVCAFVQALHVRRELSQFKGDPQFLRDSYAQDWFAMSRHGTAALYQWRCINATEVPEKQRMLNESLLAYMQTFALCPAVALDFADLLIQVQRPDEAKEVTEVALALYPQNADARALFRKLSVEGEKP